MRWPFKDLDRGWHGYDVVSAIHNRIVGSRYANDRREARRRFKTAIMVRTIYR